MIKRSLLACILTWLVIVVRNDDVTEWTELQLPEEHVPYFFRNNPDVRERCAVDRNCPYKDYVHVKRCWGYEDTCDVGQRMSMPHCTQTGDKRLNLEQRVDRFWREVDFGYVLENKKSLVTYCRPRHQDDSSLQCVSGLRYCRSTNLYLDLRTANITSHTNRYRMDTVKAGEIGGHCELDKDAYKSLMNINYGFLSSWTPELQHFQETSFRPISDGHCDVIIDKPTFIIKLDYGGNMFHHFCDFMNLYISQHVNNTFSKDVNIFFWHPVLYGYVDIFYQTWRVFTKNPILELREFDGKTVCFKEAVFSFLARMPFGLFYAVKPVENCSGSSMMRAFSQHALHRLGVEQVGPRRDKLRVTFLSRSTPYRRILNEEKIVSMLRSNERLEVQLVDFKSSMEFVDQLKISQNTDILIGIHGAGLTHLLFLPDWAVVFEIYNCEDPDCYLDLARMRGVKYITWEKPELVQSVIVDSEHSSKFTNYILDEKEVLRLVTMATDHVSSHHAFISSADLKHKESPIPKVEL